MLAIRFVTVGKSPTEKLNGMMANVADVVAGCSGVPLR
jgi:hypothetical protein